MTCNEPNPIQDWSPLKRLAWLLFWGGLVGAAFLWAINGQAASKPPSRLVWDNYHANSNYWAKISMSVHCWVTNFPPAWFGAHFEQDAIPSTLKGAERQLALTTAKWQIVANHTLTLADFPPRRQWPKIATIAGTQSVPCSYVITNPVPSQFFFVSTEYKP